MWERSRLTGRWPAGRVNAGGSGRLLRAADGWVAVNLPRPDDLELLPAWLGLAPCAGPAGVPWSAIASAVRRGGRDELAASGQELGLAVAVVADAGRLVEGDEQLRARGVGPGRWGPPTTPSGDRSSGRRLADLVVVDLSSLWAGPTCARLLTAAGARVVKVESSERPDGARRGHAGFYDALHAGQEERAVAFTTPQGVAELRGLLAGADVVIEGSRPRALERLGIEPAEVVAARPGAVWLSITAYGRTGPWRDRVGFGDDTAAAGGLVTWTAGGEPHLVGDAVADPLTGMVGAALVAGAVRDGGGVLLDVALREVARAAALGLRPVWGGSERAA